MSQIIVPRKNARWHDRLRDYRVVVDGCEAARIGNGATAAVTVGKNR
jgi:hypothetical protein